MTIETHSILQTDLTMDVRQEHSCPLSAHDDEIFLTEKPSNRDMKTFGDGKDFVIHQIADPIFDFGNSRTIDRNTFCGETPGEVFLAKRRMKPSPGNADFAANNIPRFEFLVGMLHFAGQRPARETQASVRIKRSKSAHLVARLISNLRENRICRNDDFKRQTDFDLITYLLS